MDTSIQPQFSGTFGVWTDQSSVEKWASSLAVSPVSHLVQRESYSERLMNAISGRKRGELFLRWDPNGSCWRTCQLCFTAMDETGQPMGEPFLETLPKWATISNMELRVLPMPEPPISGNGSGSWPTPSALDSGWKHIELVDKHGCSPPCYPNQRFYDKNTGRLVQKGLPQMVQWPTPTVAEANKIANRANYGQVGLSNHPNIVGTPDREPMAKSRHGDGRSTTSGVSNEGVLNPGWVTWLMGLPQNWVTLEPVSEESLAEWETRMADGSWWEDEHDLPRTVPSRKGRVDMLKALGNGIVPRTIPTFLNYARSN